MEITTKKNIIVEVTVVIELFLTFAGIGLFTFTQSYAWRDYADCKSH